MVMTYKKPNCVPEIYFPTEVSIVKSMCDACSCTQIKRMDVKENAAAAGLDSCMRDHIEKTLVDDTTRAVTNSFIFHNRNDPQAQDQDPSFSSGTMYLIS